MTSEGTMGRQFKTLYRGLAGVKSLEDIDFGNLGQHWTSKMNVAEDFAFGEGPEHHGVIITAKVPRDAYEGPNSLVGVNVHRGGGGGMEGDFEHTLYPQTAIRIKKIEHRRGGYSTATWTDLSGFPKEATATDRP